ncbi:hypothetical protein NFI96_008278, partial [Prochilodus magdalenae]
MGKTKGNTKAEPSEGGGPAEAPSRSGKDNPEASTQSADQQAVLAAIASLQAELSQAKSDICTKIDEKTADVSTVLRGEIAAVKAESDNAFITVHARLDGQNDTLKSLVESANANSDVVADLEAKVKALQSQVDQLSEKCLDLEGRSKRQNLRIAGVKEGLENGQKTRDFVAQLLTDVLQLEEKPVIDRAHRALRARLGDNEPPRHLIIRVHYCHAFEEILKKVMQSRTLTYQGKRIQIFRDFPPAVVKRRAAFTPARNLLRDKPGVRFGLVYPAKLRVTHNGKETTFTDAEEARLFAERLFGRDHETPEEEER